MMALVIKTLLLTLLKVSFAQDCCFKKEVGGIRYLLVAEEDTSAFMCNDNCVYAEDSDSDARYCFRDGGLTFSCVYQQAPVMTAVKIEEGNESIVQENHFHEDTGILTVTVPEHKNYSKSTFFLHEESSTSLLKTGGLCHLTDLPDHINITAMAEGFKTHDRMRAGDSNGEEQKSFLIKSKAARYGVQKRAEKLHPEAEYLCKDAPVVKTNDAYVSEEEFEKYNNGEIITVGNEEGTRQDGSCELKWSVSKAGHNACGYSWVNPAGGGISTHEVSAIGYNVTCAIPRTSSNNLLVPCEGYRDTFCNCIKIQKKSTLLRCFFKGRAAIKSRINLGRGRTELVQTMVYNSTDEGHAVVITGPSYGGYEEIEVVMNAHKDGWWHEGVYPGTLQNNQLMRIKDVCFIATLLYDMFPADIAHGISEIKEGNEVTTKDDEKDQLKILMPDGDGVLTAAEFENLHSEIKERCKSAAIHKFYTPQGSQGQKLKEGGVVIVKENEDIGYAAKVTDEGSGSWRYPNFDEGAVLWVNEIVSPVKTVSCCLSEECSDAGVFCDCDQIDSNNFDQCYLQRSAKKIKSKPFWSQ